MSDNNTSTLQATYDKISGAAQSTLGSLIGSTEDQQKGEARKDVADAKNDLSHTGGTVGGYSVSASGVAANDPNRYVYASACECLRGKLIVEIERKEAGTKRSDPERSLLEELWELKA